MEFFMEVKEVRERKEERKRGEGTNLEVEKGDV